MYAYRTVSRTWVDHIRLYRTREPYSHIQDRYRPTACYRCNGVTHCRDCGVTS